MQASGAVTNLNHFRLVLVSRPRRLCCVRSDFCSILTVIHYQSLSLRVMTEYCSYDSGKRCSRGSFGYEIL